jgi:TatD DNase family protein
MISKSDLYVIDTHAHLDMPEFDADRDEAIKRAREAGVGIINTIGIDVESSRRAIGLAEKYPGIVASVGLSPQEAGIATEDDISLLSGLAGHPRVVAIGEVGLDFYYPQPPREAQLRALNWQLDLARKVELPIIIHCRQAQNVMMPLIAGWCHANPLPDGASRGVLHCFNGDMKTAEWYMERGFLISVGAYIGYPSSGTLRETVAGLPLEKLVIETDSPFLPPQKCRGKRNEPSYILSTLKVVAGLKNLSPEAMARETSRNAARLFNYKL